MRIKILFKIVVILILFQSCKTVFPKTERDCIKEAEKIMELTSKPNYVEGLQILKKYEDFSKYDKNDFQKTYEKLNKYLSNTDFNNFQFKIKKDTSNLNFSNALASVAFFEICFYNITGNNNTEKNVCTFSYSKANNENHYILTNYIYNFSPKITPFLPK